MHGWNEKAGCAFFHFRGRMQQKFSLDRLTFNIAFGLSMKIVISGLGLMGASLALALKTKKIEAQIWGYDYPAVCEKATNLNLIDKTIRNWPDDCRDADIIFLATPIQIIEKQIRDLNTIVSRQTIVTDLGSTKGNVHRLVEQIDFTGSFIGGHPMTGGEKSGLDAADPLLYENAVYILTGVEGEKRHLAETKLFPVLETLKARLLLLNPYVHDQIMARISHLPQLLAVGLVEMVGAKNDPEKPYFELAAGGFRDLTRIASSNFAIWKDILLRNKQNVQEALRELIELLQHQYDHIEDLSEDFHLANYYRSQIPKSTKGFLHPLTDVLVYVDDRPGVIARMSNALAREQIDIRDIELLKVREEEGGVFRISFSGKEEAEKAIKILEKHGFRAFISD
ncbi:hypothetical protein DRI50_02045 [candidate division KSB1 bacterium]|nr:MAG: hypothetical protein DRI50_02045 [candidate division KSB1 bacterium]